MMVPFCGQDRCLIDANGRVKLGARFLSDFRRIGDHVVLHCLPEGALAVYPVPVWEQMRQADAQAAAAAARSIVMRRTMRRFGAMTQQEKISNQGRLTLPPLFREQLALEGGTDAVVVGCEVGVEIWNAARWTAELDLLQVHQQRLAEAEMAAEIERLTQSPTCAGGG